MIIFATNSVVLDVDRDVGIQGAGAHARVLRLVREQNVIPLMEALAKLSYYQARFLQDMAPDMRYRGRVQSGAVADLTPIDFDKVKDTAGWKAGDEFPAFRIMKDGKIYKNIIE